MYNLKIYLLCLIVEITEVVEVAEPVEVAVTVFLVVVFVFSIMDLESLNLIGLKCPSPRKIKLSALDKDGEYREIQERYVPCGKCYVCLSARRMQWQFRLEMESIRWKSSLFVTLTYNDDTIPDVGVYKPHLQSLFKSLRYRGLKFKYYAIGEYGSRTHRPHYHVLFFTDDDLRPWIDTYWLYGFTYFGKVSVNSIGYVLHYHIRPKICTFQPDLLPTFCIMSKGLGVDFIDLRMQRFIESKDDFIVRNFFGTKSILPRYYRKKFFSDKVVDIDHNKFEIPSGLEHSAEYLFSLREAYKAKLNKFNNQDKL